jgi:hypothetical protein
MNKSLRILKIVGIVAVVVAAGVALGWLGTRGSQRASRTPDSQVPASDSASATPDVSPAPTRSAPGILNAQPGSVETVAVTPMASNLMTNWEDRLDEILGGEGEEADKAKQMLEMFPRLPEEGQVEVAQHLSNLTADKDYAPLGAYLTNSATSEQVLDVLMGDLLNRPNSVKLPVLLDVAREPQHPKAGEAKDILQLFLEEDYGADWNAWQTKMQQWLADNPD